MQGFEYHRDRMSSNNPTSELLSPGQFRDGLLGPGLFQGLVSARMPGGCRVPLPIKR